MGSKSTLLRNHLGGVKGRKLEKSDEIGFVSAKTILPNMEARKVPASVYPKKEIVLRVVLGPQDDEFTEAGVKSFFWNSGVITNEFDRMGCRIEREPIEHVGDGNINTDGISVGSIQVPTNGKPIIMLSDRQSTGGYAKIGTVISVDLAKIAQAQPGQPEVQFNDVVFAYQDKEVLHHISFAMKKDSMTALVGPSGSGKSTIANLLARLWDVKSGSIIIRGMDIRNVPLAELMEQISMVFQRVYLFQDTIYNNISIGKPDATEEEVYAAAKKARCYDFIMALPDGFQTVVGEGGATLSGGEKQRISIARCILKDAPIIILDEATASVDTDNESYIQEAISELVKGKTLLVIAHRLNTIQNADQILVIDNGQIAQQGTHEELLKQPGIYQEFVNIRKNAAGWSLA